MSLPRNLIFCALDTNDLDKAQKWAEMLRQHVGGFKLGLEFFLAHGMTGYKKISQLGAPIFLDLKLHDIPNTVAGALTSLVPLKPNFITLHTSGGEAMLKAAVKALSEIPKEQRPKLLGVTVLTSLDSNDLKAVGQDINTSQQTLRLAKLAQQSGLDGIICSPAEVSMLREALGTDFVLMVPGIRPSWSGKNDQKRTLSPKEAVAAGASYLVIGRPITENENPAAAAERIVSELA